MKKFTYKTLSELLKSKAVLAVAGGLLLMSCGSQMGGYSETDGVYYDPNRDTLPEGTVMNSGNRIGEYYDYKATDDQNKYLNAENRNESWKNDPNSDWGNYAGTDTFYNDTWGYPYGMYSGFGWGMNFGFGAPWGYGGFYNPWGFGYNPWYGHYSPWFGHYNPYYGYYNPYYGYNPYGYYSPYGYGSGYNSYNGGFTYKRSGTDGSFRNSQRNSNPTMRTENNPNSGFRNDNPRINNQQNNPRFNQPDNNTQPRLRNNPQPNVSPRQNSTPRQSTPTYNEPRIRSNSNDGGGFRSGSSSGGFNSGSSGSSSGTTRSSGGFR